MPLTVRLGPKEERLLNALAKARRLSRSDVVREALTVYGASDSVDTTTDGETHAAWHDILGIVSLGARDPERTTGEQFTDVIRRRSRARRSR
jgi:hypothetical protein